MNKKILVTDSLFILDEHVKQLEDAGYEVERLDKPKATDIELVNALKGKVGYLLGGIEYASNDIIKTTKDLKVISALATDVDAFLDLKSATKNGIAVTNTPGTVTEAVSEWAIGAMLLMNCKFLELGKFGDKTFSVTDGVEGLRIGIVGFGRIGTRIAEILNAFKPADISYFSRNRKPDKEKLLNVIYKPLNEIFSSSDIIFLCVSSDAEKGFIGINEFKIMKNDSLLVSFLHPGIIDEEALLSVLKIGRIRAISDYPMANKEYGNLPVTNWYSFKSSNTNSKAKIKKMSDMATDSIISFLKTGNDKHIVNPEFR